MSWEYGGYDRGRRAVKKRRRHRRRIYRIKQMALCMVMIGVVCIGITAIISIKRIDIERVKEMEQEVQRKAAETQMQEIRVDSREKKEDETRTRETEEFPVRNWEETETCLEKLADCPLELQELLEKYPETYDYVMGYSERAKYKGKSIDLSEELEEGEVPLLLQWDKRWGYDNYGDKLIGVAGCGPTCMSMAYIYLTGDTEMNPREMAEFADRNGYNAEAGTKWDFFTEGAALLGLKGRGLELSEEEMKAALDCGKVIICSMSPGDFTKTGHFILICGYDRKGFQVNDPNSRINSEKRWDYETLRDQIKGQWSIGIESS